MSLLLSLVLLMLTLATQVLAYDFKSGELYYTIVSQRDKTVEVAYGKTTYSNRVVVPARVKYQNKLWEVIGLGTDAFYGSNKLTELVLPEGMKYIAGGALDYCSSLSMLTLPEGITLRSSALRHA